MALVLTVFLALWFGGLDHRKLVEPDEGRYAEVAREMIATGDFVTPRLNGFKHFTKPPMQYWMTAIAFRVFGVNEWTSRLWPALAGMLALLVASFTVRHLHGTQAGLSCAAVLASSLYFVFFAQVGTVDMGLTLFVTASMCAIMLGLNAPPGSKTERNWMLLAWASMGLGALSKGLVGVVFPLMVAALYALAERQWGLWRRLHPVKGMGTMLALAAPWFVAVSLRNSEFPAFFFLEEHFARFASTAHRREQPIWFFIPLVLVGMLPWTWIALEGLRAGWRDAASASFRPGRFLVVWAAAILIFFTASRAKMPAYVLPAIPALGMLAGWRIATLDARAASRRVLPLLASMGIAIAIAAAFAPHTTYAQSYRILYERYALWLYAAGATAFAASVLIATLRLPPRWMAAWVGLAGLVSVQICILGFESLSPLRSSHALAREIAVRASPETQVFMVGASYLSLPFYLGRTVALAQETGQMSFGVRLEPHRALLEPAQFSAAWLSAPSAIALMDLRTYESSRAAGLSMQVLCRDSKRALVIRPDRPAVGFSHTPPDCVLQALKN